ncbi:hypothetical protein J3F84DRAFT_383447 [Trichoderma pleuroticola]
MNILEIIISEIVRLKTTMRLETIIPKSTILVSAILETTTPLKMTLILSKQYHPRIKKQLQPLKVLPTQMDPITAPHVFVYHQGCCYRHNSLWSPNRNHLEPLKTSQVLSGWWSNGIHLIQMGARDSNARTPSSSMQLALTLAPIHSAISYHLSLDNLHHPKWFASPTGTGNPHLQEKQTQKALYTLFGV